MEKPNCKNHVVPEYLQDLKQVAEDLGDMPYDKLAEFFDHFQQKMDLDSYNDGVGGRSRVSNLLRGTQLRSLDLKIIFDKLWKVCEPFMK